MATQEAQITIMAKQSLLAQGSASQGGVSPPVIFNGGITSIDIGLFQAAVAGTAPGNEYGSSALEVAGAGYLRKTVALSALTLSNNGQIVSNGAVIDFAAASGAWATAHIVNIYATGQNNILASGILVNDITLANLDVFEFAIGTFLLRCVLVG